MTLFCHNTCNFCSTILYNAIQYISLHVYIVPIRQTYQRCWRPKKWVLNFCANVPMVSKEVRSSTLRLFHVVSRTRQSLAGQRWSWYTRHRTTSVLFLAGCSGKLPDDRRHGSMRSTVPDYAALEDHHCELESGNQAKLTHH